MGTTFIESDPCGNPPRGSRLQTTAVPEYARPDSRTHRILRPPCRGVGAPEHHSHWKPQYECSHAIFDGKNELRPRARRITERRAEQKSAFRRASLLRGDRLVK